MSVGSVAERAVADGSISGRPKFDPRHVTPYLFILPAVLVIFAGLVYPILDAFYLSFYDWKLGTPISKAPYAGL